MLLHLFPVRDGILSAGAKRGQCTSTIGRSDRILKRFPLRDSAGETSRERVASSHCINWKDGQRLHLKGIVTSGINDRVVSAAGDDEVLNSDFGESLANNGNFFLKRIELEDFDGFPFVHN